MEGKNPWFRVASPACVLAESQSSSFEPSELLDRLMEASLEEEAEDE